MQKSAPLVACFVTLVSAFLTAPTYAAQRPSPGNLVIVFKDGHRQTFSLADIDRVEFPNAATASNDAPSGYPSVPRGRFFGKWVVGDGAGNDFNIVLKENGDAWRSLGNVSGKWSYVNGEAQIVWQDGAQDAIRKVGSRFQKFAYSAGKKFTDEPDNVAGARSTGQRPI